MEEPQRQTKNFRDLIIWQRGVLLAEQVYQKTEGFPKAELYGLVSQMRRAAVSIPSNIAEGAERDSVKEFIHFLHIAKGSAAELRTQIYIAEKIGILHSQITKPLISETKELSAMLHGLINSKTTKQSPLNT